MSLLATKPKVNIRTEFTQNKQLYGLSGKQLLESDKIADVRALIGAGRKNVVINGDFKIWQRGSVLSTSDFALYHSDRWYSQYGQVIPSGTITYSKESDSTFNSFLRINNTSTISIANILETKIENVNTLADSFVTLSFYIKSNGLFDFNDAAASSVIQQQFGTGGSPSPAIGYSFIDGNMSNSNVTTTWKRITTTLKLISTADKTVGTNGNDYLRIYFGLPITNGLIVDIAQIQLEEGTQATNFEYRPIADEIQLCQRHYQKSYDIDTTPGTINAFNGEIRELGVRNNANATHGSKFLTPMRASPTTTIYSSATGNSGVVSNNGDVVANAIDINKNGFSAISLTSGLINNDATYQYTASAEL